MVIDSSVILALILKEQERQEFKRKIAADPVRLMSAATYLETTIVLEGRTRKSANLEILFRRAKIEIVSVDEDQTNLARDAWRRFGKGRHPAGLNFGDCFSYALAKSKGEKLLFKGSDFSQTDIAAA